jgi:hypothetical protein
MIRQILIFVFFLIILTLVTLFSLFVGFSISRQLNYFLTKKNSKIFKGKSKKLKEGNQRFGSQNLTGNTKQNLR